MTGKKSKEKELTEFQKRVLHAIETGPNMHANWWEVAWNGFAKEWNAKRSGHGILITHIQRAAHVLKERGLIVILSPRDQWSAATYCRIHKAEEEDHG